MDQMHFLLTQTLQIILLKIQEMPLVNHLLKTQIIISFQGRVISYQIFARMQGLLMQEVSLGSMGFREHLLASLHIFMLKEQQRH
jgi:hypothetical protein